MSAWILGGSLALLTAAVGLPYVWFVRRGTHRATAGLRAIAALRWRELSTLVGQAMQQRGLRHAGRGHGEAAPPGDGSRLLMTDGSQRWLLACKHGSAYRLGSHHVTELAAEMELAEARHGILLTEGRARAGALAAAARHDIEVIDGRRLWTLLRPYVGPETRTEVEAAAEARSRTEAFCVAGLALALGALGVVSGDALVDGLATLRAPRGNVEPQALAAAAAPAASPAVAPREPERLPEDAGIEDFPDEATLQHYRNEVVRGVSLQPGIGRVFWLTHNTLVVDRTGTIEAIWPLVCAELERYPALRTVRVQLNPRPGREEQVRWRQCRVQ